MFLNLRISIPLVLTLQKGRKSMLEETNTTNAPGAVGPFSQAIKVGNLLYVSGQLPIDPATGEFNSEDAIAQADQCLKC